MLAFDILIFGIALWLGLYLIARDLKNPRLRLAGLGLVSYALGWGCDILSNYAPTPALTLSIISLGWPFFFLPALFWTGAIFYLLPEDISLRIRLTNIWRYGLLPITACCFLLSEGALLLFDGTTSPLFTQISYVILGVVVLFPLLIAVCIAWRALRLVRPKNATGMLLASLLFFTLSTGLLLFPQGWLPHIWVLLLIGCDLLSLGVAVAVLDAFDQGEALLPDFFRSFDFSFGVALLFGGQVALVMLLSTGLTFPMLLLLLAVIATSIATQTFSQQVRVLLDRVAFANFPGLRQKRTELLEAADALPRLNEALDLETLDEAEFLRLTRRALSHFGDLSRLAASPLTHLPLVETRLHERGAKDDAIERAIELKTLLTESITRLKPRNKGDFGTSDEWRYYNALYFPYVVGLKPYSRRASSIHSNPTTKEALEWFRTSVPERTLHNWQIVAAKLVAQDLRKKRDS